MKKKSPRSFSSTGKLSAEQQTRYKTITATAYNIFTEKISPLDFSNALSLREAIEIVRMPVDIIHSKVRADGLGILTRETPELLLLCPDGCTDQIPALKPSYPWDVRTNFWTLAFVDIYDSWGKYSPYTWVLTHNQIET